MLENDTWSPADTRNSDNVRPFVSALACSLLFISDVHRREIFASLDFNG
ncbi:MAG: hypothetical protein M1162_04845 [Candidatus Thermoplasmatota archaeon]|nr:hypothetical protein [Candidatus Thermoplasmatota archaeon]